MKEPRVHGIPKIRIYDNTMIVDAQTCLRLFYLRHKRFFTPSDVKIWFDFGASWHRAMDIVWTILSKNHMTPIQKVVDLSFDAFCDEWVVKRKRPGPDDMELVDMEVLGPRNPMVAMEMLHHYIEKRMPLFKNPSFRLLAVEEPFAVPIHGSNHQILYVGRCDKIIEINRMIRAVEHKTTTAFKYPHGLSQAYLESFSPNSQVDGYTYQGKFKYGSRFRGVYVDIALVHKEVHDVFHLLPIERSPGDLDAWLWDIWYWIHQIEENNKALLKAPEGASYLPAFPKSTRSCYQFPHSCPFLDTCRNNPNPRRIATPAGFRKEKWEPFELLELQKIGLKKENVS